MKILKSWGTDGKVVISLVSSDSGDLEIDEPVFITFDGLPVPFFVESVEYKGNRRIVKFQDVDTAQAAEELVGREAVIDRDEECDDEPSLEGMSVIDSSTGEEVGKITAFDDFAGNTCITVVHNGEEILLPLHEDLICSIDEQRGTITLTIPEGLL